MTCDHALELLSAALDGELSTEEKARLDRHLAQCEECRALLNDLAAIHGACGELEVAPPPALRENILQNLPAQEKPAKVILIHWKRWAAMAAAFVLVSLAAWNLPKTGLTNGTQGAPEQSVITQGALTDTSESPSPLLDDYPASGSSLLDNGSDSAGSSLETASESPLGAVIAPSAAPDFSNADPDSSEANSFLTADFFDGEPVNVNSYTPSAAKITGYGIAQKQSAETAVKAEKSSVTYATYKGMEDLAEDIAILEKETVAEAARGAAEVAGVSAEDTPMPYASRMASPSPAPWDDEERPEPHPDMAEEENVPAVLLTGVADGKAATVYCGVLTIQGDMPLKDHVAQVQENGEIWYELPSVSFYALVNELTNSTADFVLRITGADISPSAQTGRVIVRP